MKIKSLLNNLPDNIILVAVSKTHPVLKIHSKIQEGYRHFGENRVKELLEKQKEINNPDIYWHLIGPLQKNKVRKIVGKIFLFHALDSLELWEKIKTISESENKITPALIQINISEESQKSGILAKDLQPVLEYISSKASAFAPIKGLACIGSNINIYGENKVKEEFKHMRQIFDFYKKELNNPFLSMDYLSMGMSQDYHLAIEARANMLRVGSAIFGARDYNG